MVRRKMTRADYARMIGLKQKRKRAIGVHPRVNTLDAVILSKLASRAHNKNSKLRNAVISNMSSQQLNDIGRIVLAMLQKRRRQGMLSRDQIKQLNRHRRMLSDFVTGRGSVAHRRKALKGGFVGALLPMLLGPVVKSVVAPLVGPLVKTVAGALMGRRR